MDEHFTYRTLNGASNGEFRDRGSKFLAYAWPVQDVSEIKAHLQGLKKEYPKAVHYCYAWRLGTDGTQFRANDDGEPSGSAGRPILGQIDSMQITNALVVVVRYFGGTLLGVPGLINAYKTASAAALSQSQLVEKWIEELVEINFDYPVMGEVLYHLRQAEATVYEQDLQLFCRVKAGIPVKFLKACLQKLSELRSLSISPRKN